MTLSSAANRSVRSGFGIGAIVLPGPTESIKLDIQSESLGYFASKSGLRVSLTPSSVRTTCTSATREQLPFRAY
jgi:hypothetical protein